jgi:hypothetical protein
VSSAAQVVYLLVSTLQMLLLVSCKHGNRQQQFETSEAWQRMLCFSLEYAALGHLQAAAAAPLMPCFLLNACLVQPAVSDIQGTWVAKTCQAYGTDVPQQHEGL